VSRRLPAVALLLVALALSGCTRGVGAGAKRIIEREEVVGASRVKLRSELNPARGTLGDPITWRLTASLPEGLKSTSVLLTPPPSTLEVDSARAAPGVGNARSRVFILRGFDLGPIPLPRATLVVMAAGKLDTLEFPSDTLFVDSLSTQAAGQLRPDRGAIQTPLRPIDLAVLIGGAALLLAILLFLVRSLLRSRRRRAEIAAAPAPVEPPESILGRELDLLERELASLPRDIFYERLAQVLRTYAAAVTGVLALDLTTSELDKALSGHERRELLIAALRRADLAKFGRYQDEESEARAILSQARSVAGTL